MAEISIKELDQAVTSIGNQRVAAICGGRDLPSKYRLLVKETVSELEAQNYAIMTGCARGADSYARMAVSSPLVFEVGNFTQPSDSFVTGLCRRSAAMVEAMYAAYMFGDAPDAIVIAFANDPCPARLLPKPNNGQLDYIRDFTGYGSGTWSTVCFAASMGLRIVVFACGWQAKQLPPGWGEWQPYQWSNPAINETDCWQLLA